MKAHGRKLSVFLAVALSSLLLARAAGAQDAGAEKNQLVVDGKSAIVKLELDRAPLRIDMERYRQHLRASLERALAGQPPSRAADRVAAAEPQPRG